jgi:hypothetical protein
MHLRDAILIIDRWDGIEHSQEQILEAWQYVIDCGALVHMNEADRQKAADLIARGLCRRRPEVFIWA